ncbi:MAG TPA: hypothetical protein VMZ25_08445 [Terriglobales bacterium]|nr:hypothetical protein [Terriglobales bacterium]
MPDLKASIHRAIQDLQAIKVDLEAGASAKASVSQKERVIADPQAMFMLRELKTEVDHMRHLLWAYIEAPDHSTRDVAARLQSVRMQRVTEMLKALEPEVTKPATAKSPEATTFLELIHDIAHNTLDRHQAE